MLAAQAVEHDCGRWRAETGLCFAPGGPDAAAAALLDVEVDVPPGVPSAAATGPGAFVAGDGDFGAARAAAGVITGGAGTGGGTGAGAGGGGLGLGLGEGTTTGQLKLLGTTILTI